MPNTQTNTDAELLALAAKYRSLMPIHDAMSDDDESSEFNETEMMPLVDRMVEIDAQTAEGVLAKMVIIADQDMHDALFESVKRDAERLA